MIYNVVTSLNRYENLRKLANWLYQEDCIWHVVYDEQSFFSLKSKCSWMSFYPCKQMGGLQLWQRCHFALNWFLDHVPIHDDQFYCFLNDDDAYEPEFFRKVEKARLETNANLMIVSMQRGSKIPEGVAPERAHGDTTLVACRENMKPCYVGLEQMIVRGDLLAGVRIPLDIDGDGQMIAWMCNQFSPTFLPDTYAYFNFFEPGRWQK